MPNSERIVLRSSWPGIFAVLAPVFLVVLGFQIWRGFLEGGLVVLVLLGSMAFSARFLAYVELTAQGLDIHTLGARHVPWQNIGTVEQVNRQGGHQLRIYDLAQRGSRFLPAPRGAFGVGKAETAAAHDIIEQWWLVYRGSPPPTPPARVAPTYPLSGEALDPYRPPAEG